MPEENGKISVCMATHNGERFISRQLETILYQLGPEDELIISDDSSTDSTVAIIKVLSDPRIRLSESNTFYNATFNFEHALEQATGDIIVLADQDDVWIDNKIALIRETFDRQLKRPYLIALDGYVVDEAENITHDSIFQVINAGRGFWKNIYNNRYMGCCLAFSRDLLAVALPFPRRIPMHDMWLGQLCELVGETEFVPVKTIMYRRHGASQTEFVIRFKPLVQISRRFWLAWHLLLRWRMRSATVKDR
ncbi:glycosyltransferase family 2 protein [Geotalea sp. SG265]|uniref:glycosyltransferase family 2 protein n=1 Tax=Geotalea sp. SG265 TaxID=2922867 RepID=UPI001FAF9639|nr:glycosyltransferase family 2 protein [Geotalea sp. SG265]